MRLLTTWLPIHQRPTIKQRPCDQDVTEYKQNYFLTKDPRIVRKKAFKACHEIATVMRWGYSLLNQIKTLKHVSVIIMNHTFRQKVVKSSRILLLTNFQSRLFEMVVYTMTCYKISKGHYFSTKTRNSRRNYLRIDRQTLRFRIEHNQDNILNINNLFWWANLKELTR